MKSHKPIPKKIIAFNKKALFRAHNSDVLRDFEELRDILFEARGCYKLWWAYLQAIGNVADFPAILKLKDFFQTSAYAYVSNLIVSLHKLFDGGYEVLNIQGLINEMVKRNLLDSSEQASLKTLVEKAKLLWKKVVILRSNLFAHRTNKLSREEIYKLAKITPDEMRDLTDMTLQILNVAAQKLYEPNQRFRDLEESDMRTLLAILKKA